jgi:hypothetical protein
MKWRERDGSYAEHTGVKISIRPTAQRQVSNVTVKPKGTSNKTLKQGMYRPDKDITHLV